MLTVKTPFTGTREVPERGQRGDREGTDKEKKSIILTEKQQKVLDLIIKDSAISCREIAAAMEIKDGIVIKHLESLKKRD